MEESPTAEEAEVRRLREILALLGAAGKLGWEDRASLCEEGLDLLPKEVSPSLWAYLQSELGRSLAQCPSPDRFALIIRAASAFEESLTVYTAKNDPEAWAAVQHNLGNLYREQAPLGWEYSERAVVAYEAALRIYRKETHTDLWALAQMGLGNAYREWEDDGFADHIENSITAFRAAESVFLRRTQPVAWARIQHGLGSAYQRRKDGNHAENLEVARAYFESALPILASVTPLADWAATQSNLGSLYRERVYGDLAANRESAIRCFEAALNIYTRRTYPDRFSAVQNNLGNALLERISGERAENVEIAIQAFEAALEVRLRERYPLDWAVSQSNLGNAYRRRLQGDPTDNRLKAIAAYRSALDVLDTFRAPFLWAQVKTNLATVLRERHWEESEQGEREQQIEDAISLYHEALRVYSQETAPFEWADTQDSLGNAYRDRITGNRIENLDAALIAFHQALRVRTLDGYPAEWASTQNNIGNVYREQKNYEKAREAYQASLTVFRAGTFPHQARITGLNAANVEIALGNWEAARDELRRSASAADQMYATAVSEEGKRAESAVSTTIYQRLVDVSLRIDPISPWEILRFAEESRSRLLRDEISGLPLAQPENVESSRFHEETELIANLRRTEQLARVENDPASKRQLIEYAGTLRKHLSSVWDSIATTPEGAAYVTLRRGDNLNTQQLLAWLNTQNRNVSVLAFYTLEDRIIAILLRTSDAEPIVLRLSLTPQRVLDAARRAYRELHQFRSEGTLRETWARHLSSCLTEEVFPYLTQTELLYIVPHGNLHYLPIHAVPCGDDILLARFPIVYVPSVSVLLRLASREKATPEERVTPDECFVVGNATADLPFAEKEAILIGNQFGVNPLLRDDATRERVVESLQRKKIAHLATHAQFFPNDPLQSSLALSDSVVTAGEIFRLNMNLHLAVLSACQTGVQGIEYGDDLNGLARAFLYSGTRTQVLSQWSVQDNSTAFLMERFYQSLYDDSGQRKRPVGDALRDAVLAARAQYPHPFYWAAFFVYGDGV